MQDNNKVSNKSNKKNIKLANKKKKKSSDDLLPKFIDQVDFEKNEIKEIIKPKKS